MVSKGDPLRSWYTYRYKWQNGKGILWKRKSKESWSSNTYIKQNRHKINIVTRDKEGYYIMTKGATQEKNLTVVNRYAPNIGAQGYVRQILLDTKREVNNNTIIVGNFKFTYIDGKTIQTENQHGDTGLNWNIRLCVCAKSL